MTTQGTEARRGETVGLDAKRDGLFGAADAPQPADNAETIMTDVQQAVPVAQGYTEAEAMLRDLLLPSQISDTAIRVARDHMMQFVRLASLPCKSGEGAGEAIAMASRLQQARHSAVEPVERDNVLREAATLFRRFAALAPDATQTREAEGVTVAEYNEVYDKFEEVVGGAFRDGFQEGWVFAQAPDGTDYDDRQEEYGRTVDIEPSEAWEGYRDKYAAMLPVPALLALNARDAA